MSARSAATIGECLLDSAEKLRPLREQFFANCSDCSFDFSRSDVTHVAALAFFTLRTCWSGNRVAFFSALSAFATTPLNSNRTLQSSVTLDADCIASVFAVASRIPIATISAAGASLSLFALRTGAEHDGLDCLLQFENLRVVRDQMTVNGEFIWVRHISSICRSEP